VSHRLALGIDNAHVASAIGEVGEAHLLRRQAQQHGGLRVGGCDGAGANSDFAAELQIAEAPIRLLRRGLPRQNQRAKHRARDYVPNVFHCAAPLVFEAEFNMQSRGADVVENRRTARRRVFVKLVGKVELAIEQLERR